MTNVHKLMSNDTPFEELLSANIRMIMGIRGYNIADLIKKSKISRPTIANLLNNRSKGVQFFTIKSIAKALEVQPFELFQIR